MVFFKELSASRLWKNLHIYERIIIVFIAMTIPTYFLGMMMKNNGSKFIEGNIINSLNASMAFYSNIFDHQVNQLQMQQIDLLNNYDLQYIAVFNELDTFNKVDKLNSLKRYLIYVKNSSEFADDIGVYIRSINKTISARDNLRNAPNEIYDVLRDYFIRNGLYKPTYVTTHGDIYIIKTLSYQRAKLPEDTLYTTFIKLNGQRLKELLKSMCQYRGSVAFIAVDSSIVGTSDPDSSIMLDTLEKLRETGGNMGKNSILKLGNSDYVVTSSNFESLGMKLFLCIPRSQIFGDLEKYSKWFILFSAISLIVMLTFALYVNKTIHTPLKNLTRCIELYKAGFRDSFITDYDKADEFSYIYRNFNEMVMEIDKYINEAYEQKIISQQLELKQLQSQINPHFLYNCFYNVYRLCKSEDYETLMELTRRLGSYYEYITRSGEDEAFLADEYNHARKYAEIQAIRFVNRINVVVQDLSAELEKFVVPKLILQPVIENVFTHGFYTKKNGNLTVKNRFLNNMFMFIVEDDGEGMDQDKLSLLQEKLLHPEKCYEKTGIINVCRRLKLKYGQGSGVYIKRNANGGVTCTLIIQFSKGDADNVQGLVG